MWMVDGVGMELVEDGVRNTGFDFCTPVSIRKAFTRMCDAWGGRFPDPRLRDEDPGVRCSPVLRT